MPCRTYEPVDVERADKESAQQEVRRLKNSLAKAHTHMDNLTRMLCYVVTKVVDENVDNLVLNNEIRDWYVAHRQADLDNMLELMENVDLNALPKEEFDTVDRILSKYQRPKEN